MEEKERKEESKEEGRSKEERKEERGGRRRRQGERETEERAEKREINICPGNSLLGRIIIHPRTERKKEQVHNRCSTYHLSNIIFENKFCILRDFCPVMVALEGYMACLSPCD